MILHPPPFLYTPLSPQELAFYTWLWTMTLDHVCETITEPHQRIGLHNGSTPCGVEFIWTWPENPDCPFNTTEFPIQTASIP